MTEPTGAPRHVGDDEVGAALSVRDAIDCVDRAFRLLAAGEAVNAVRQRTCAGPATLNVMWAIAPTEGVLGVKEYPTVAGSTRGAVLTLVMHDVHTGELLAVLRADRLGQLRTAAASAVATRALARPDASVLSVYGTGFQSEWQVIALAQVLPQLRTVQVVGRSPDRREALIARLRNRLAVAVEPAAPRPAAESADVIVTATAAPQPVLFGDWVRPGTHVNAIGSNHPGHAELDEAVLRRAVVVVDDAAAAAAECGDLLVNGIDPATTTELGQILLGRSPGRSDAGDITVFESQGLALQDVVCAAHVLRVVGTRPDSTRGSAPC